MSSITCQESRPVQLKTFQVLIHLKVTKLITFFIFTKDYLCRPFLKYAILHHIISKDNYKTHDEIQYFKYWMPSVGNYDMVLYRYLKVLI